jgi:uncharacterized protein (DUF1330 family)
MKGKNRMPAYVIADINVHDAEAFRPYPPLVPATLEPYGGRFVVRGGDHEVLEGNWQPHRLVVIEFPNAEAARHWYGSDAYASAKAIRKNASDGNIILVEGTD